MRQVRSIMFVILVLFGLSRCTDVGIASPTLPHQNQQTTTVNVQPFDDVPSELLDSLVKSLSTMYHRVSVKPAIKLPGKAYYQKRSRYRADTIINVLRQGTPDNQVTIGITTKDISTRKGSIDDFGIMGLGYQPGRACVVSTYRLKKNNLHLQLFKVSIHELGHTAGLPHCKKTYCYMRDAEGKNYLDKENAFCATCKSHLLSLGWIIP